MLTNYDYQLLESWESSYKQGQLTLWILLALYESPKTVQSIKLYIAAKTNALFNADDKSIYRSLRRYHDAEIVEFDLRQNPKGPSQKQYHLSSIGLALVEQFVSRNITPLISNQQIKEILS
jgi:DNA-binding PadR family transcriptional regulator